MLRGASLALVAVVPSLLAAQSGGVRPETLQQSILQAYHAGRRQFVIPPGTYRLPATPEGPHLRFQNLSDFEIDATGVHLLFTDRTRAGIEFVDCRDVRFHGATIAYETPPFTQGVIDRIAPDGESYDIGIDKGYPADLDDPRYYPSSPVGYLFDPKTRWWKPGAYDLTGDRIERLGPGLFRVHWARPLGPGRQPVAVGDLVAFRGVGPHNISVLNSTRIEIRAVTIYNSPDFAVLESGGEGGNRYTFNVERGPPPSGTQAAPLFSSTADAFHSVNTRHGPLLENCRFEGMGDDGIAIHGTYSLVMEADGNRLVISKSTFRSGDPIRFFDEKNRPAGEAVVQAVRPLPGFKSSQKSSRDTLSDNTAGPYFEITVAPPIPAHFDYIAGNPAANGSGYVVRGNSIRNHRARGMLLKADHGLVENNTIEGSTMGGIVITPEFWWNECCFSRDVTVRNNTVRRVGTAPQQLGGVVLAGIDTVPVEGCGHQDIVFEDNRLDEINGVNLLITSACRVTVRNNQFRRPQYAEAGAAGASWGEDSNSVIVVAAAQDVDFENNRVIEPGPFNRRLLDVLPTAQANGAQSGIIR